jgi:hypothetical protein
MTTVKQYADVKKSPLYKTIAPSLSREDRKEFARMLEIARDGYKGEELDFDLGQTRLPFAFLWDGTPQGFGYWRELTNRLDAAGVPGGWA